MDQKLLEKIKKYKAKGKLASKVKEVILRKLSSLFISVPFRFYLGRRPHENAVYYSNYKFYYVLKKRYRRVLRKLAVYEERDIPNEKIVWWAWLQGEDKAPELCKRCLASIRREMTDYQINVVTEDNMWDLITVPDYIRRKYEKGIISKTHFSDILRTCLLIEHGGVWIDSTVYCTKFRGGGGREVL